MTNSPLKLINKGNGAGGFRTNLNGLCYETLTDLISEYVIVQEDINYKKIIFRHHNDSRDWFISNQSKLFKFMKDYGMNSGVPKAHGCKNPDECFINQTDKRMFIIEKKFQCVNGSVCEKIQTSDFKIWQYSRTFPDYDIIYIYCLSEWFKLNCKAEIEYLQYKKVPILWGNSVDYKKDMVEFILNYE